MDAIMKIIDEKMDTLFGIPLGIMQNFMQSVKQGFILRKKLCREIVNTVYRRNILFLKDFFFRK